MIFRRTKNPKFDYRIVEKTYSDGRKEYYAQKRWWIFWYSLENDWGNIKISYRGEAEKVISNDMDYVKTRKKVSTKTTPYIVEKN
jgi:hypothetical protein